MLCPLCHQRKGRRECPALRETICPVCCGTKRLVEIACPGDCPYLTSAREHPPAVVRRQQERDVALLIPSIRNLTERQYQLFVVFHTVIARHEPEGFTRLRDADVADAAAAMASTLETAARGLIYEPAPQTLPAQRLMGELATMLAQARERGATVHDRDAAIAMRAIEQGAREAGKTTGDADTTYLALMARLLQVNRADPRHAPANPAKPGPIIIP